MRPRLGVESPHAEGLAATAAVICNDDTRGSAWAQKGAHAVGSATGNAKGRPPSGRVTESSQSSNPRVAGVVVGPASAMASSACRAPAGWLSGARRSGSIPQP
ncbi:hypothetical protein [Nocardiopsis sp. NPDC006832]|uniref:hypothetical protein n=1 Tax=Nocardiopsis sp. NPDC006832 TaxID=3157188 RepID=UPI0033CE3E8E